MANPRQPVQRIESLGDLRDRFAASLEYYRCRGGVLFISYCRYWEQHGFVQQSLARFLTENGVRVTWLDAAGWRRYTPTLYWQSELLKVRQIWRLPGERVPPIRYLSVGLQVRDIAREIQALGGNPVVWVQAGLEPGMAERLPYIDVFSTFDDPYRHPADDPLCHKARLIICQNRFTESLLDVIPEDRRVQLLPPVDLRDRNFGSTPFIFPARFPKRVMGYIGSHRSGGFDTFMLEHFIRNLPDWGFLLMGRTDARGMGDVERLKRHPNFLHIPWAKRSELASVWSQIDVSLLLYRNLPSQDGAFPVKLVEGLHFGVPAVGTQVNKTRDITDHFPCSSFADQLVEAAVKTADWPKEKVQRLYDHFRFEMDPRLQLATVTERLK
ncbi:MAG: hypothetical protein HYR96_15270 [Deltaproteobacteria bacterium]|nr:hypothetical protein [Deltaproteobacteria bacterium]MBI3296246.1 hypothetical protein [Deltaproteobacteria bacterium]